MLCYDWVEPCITREVEGIRQGGRKKRPDGIVLKMTWKVQACPKRMHSPGINGEGVFRGQLANPGSPGKMAVKTEYVGVLAGTKPLYQFSPNMMEMRHMGHGKNC